MEDLKRIRELEEQTSHKIEAAQAKARKEADTFLAEKDAKVKAELCKSEDAVAVKIEESKKRAEAEAKKILKNAETEVESLGKTASKNFEAAIKFLMSKVTNWG